MNQRSNGGRYRIGVDVGGTNTDLVLNDTRDGTVWIEKLATSPGNPAIAVLEGLQRFFARGVSPGEIGFFGHGTTVTTNALLEMKGATVGLLINEGYRGIAEVQTQSRDGVSSFDHFFQRPPPIAPASRTREIAGRIDCDGNELTPLKPEHERRAVEELRAEGVDSFAVCFLFSFMNDGHERAAGDIIRAAWPAAFVSLSCDVLPRIREWPRRSTTLLNAYLEEVLARYAGDLADGLDRAGVATRQRYLMQSNGGVMPITTSPGSRTVHTLLSGPAAGVQGAGYLLAATQGWRNLITLDMGGTSCDIAFIEDAVPLEHTEGTIAGRSIGVPALDIATISAGGGSIARVSEAALLDVGPDSAGADPGPACYGAGGELPTVTDADLVCGTLNPGFFLGGTKALDADAAARAIGERVAAPMGIELIRAAAGIVRVINARMADEIRVQAARKGVDLSDFTLVPFGGAGPVHAAAVAQELGISRVLVPANPGAFSALGLLCTDILHDYIRSELRDLAGLAPDHAETCFRELEAKAADDFSAEGLSGARAEFVREADLRYAGQGYELRIGLDGIGTGAIDAAALTALTARFHERHAALHGHAAPDAPVEIVSYRLRAIVPVPKLDAKAAAVETGSGDGDAAPAGQRDVVFGEDAAVATPVYRRDALGAAQSLTGPAVIEQPDATTVVPPGWTLRRDGYGNLVMEVMGADG